MRVLNYLLILATSTMLITTPTFAASNNVSGHQQSPVVFQVIQDQINLDKSMIKSASIVKNSDGSYGGLKIELTSDAAKELTRITSSGVGKMANLVINGKLVTSAKLVSPLQNPFLIYDNSKNNVNALTEKNAQEFINSLNKG